MTWRRWLMSLVAALSMLSGCGGGSSGGDAPPQPVPIGPPVTQTVGAAGGTVKVTASGVKTTLSIPAGALPSDTVITLTPQAPAAGEVASVKLAPGGLFFAKPVTVVLEYPAGQALDASASLRQRLGNDNSFVVTAVDTTARTLSARLTTFGGTGMDVLARSAAAPTLPGRAQALHARPLATPAAPSDGSLTATPTTPLADIITSIRRQTIILESEGDFDAAFALQASVGSLLQRRGDPGFAATATLFLREAHDTACLALVAAIAETRSTTILHASDFAPLRKRAGQWWLVAEQMDLDHVGCPRASIDDLSEASLALTQRELDFHKGKFTAATLPSLMEEPAAGVKASRRSMLELEALEAAAATLDLPPLLPQTRDNQATVAQARPLAVRSTGLAAMIQTELLDPLVTPAREAAWTVAKASQSLAQYPTVLDAFGGMPALAQDVQFVRTRVEVRMNTAGGEEVGRRVLGFDTVPDKPADPKRTDSLTVNKSGTLAISGNIANLECASAGTETLKLTLDDAEVATVSAGGGNLLAGALGTFTPTRLLQAAGLPADDTGTHTLRVRRSSSPCAATLGITDDLLATVTLSFNERRIYFSATTGGLNEGPGIESINTDGTGHAVHTINPAVPWCVPDGETPLCSSAPSAQDGQPTLSPDGSQLAFSRPNALGAGNPDGIMLASANGGGIRALTNAQGVELDHSPSWSPDGRRLAYVRDPRQTGQPQTLWVVNADGSGAVQLGSMTRFEGTAWSPDGTRLAYGGNSPTSRGLYLVPVDGSGSPRQLVSGGSASVSPSAWSPDGQRVAFSGDSATGHRAIQIVNADGTGLTTLVEAIVSTPAWSPDGSEIAYCYGSNAIQVMKIDGGTVRQLNRASAGSIQCDLSWR